MVLAAIILIYDNIIVFHATWCTVLFFRNKVVEF